MAPHSGEKKPQGSLPLEKLERTWRGALRLYGLRDLLFAKTWGYIAVYTFAGLITASLVTSLAPTLAYEVLPYSPLIPDTNYVVYEGNEALSPCVAMASNKKASIGRGWILQNQSVFFAG